MQECREDLLSCQVFRNALERRQNNSIDPKRDSPTLRKLPAQEHPGAADQNTGSLVREERVRSKQVLKKHPLGHENCRRLVQDKSVDLHQGELNAVWRIEPRKRLPAEPHAGDGPGPPTATQFNQLVGILFHPAGFTGTGGSGTLTTFIL